MIFAGKLFAADGGLRQIRQRMADEFSLNAVLAVEGLFKGEDDQHLVDVFLHQLDALFLPRPELRAYEKDDGNAEPMELLSQPEMDVWEVDENGHAGTPSANGCFEPAKFAIDARQVANDLGDAHDGHVFRAHDALEARLLHARAAHAEEGRGLADGAELLLERLDEKRAVVFATGLACRDKDSGLRHRWAASSNAQEHHS